MSVARRDDRHNDDLVREISDSFNRAVTNRPATSGEPDSPDSPEAPPAPPRFTVTGDKRDGARDKRKPR
ncbi:hypothetical protein [Amycolatopsis palatopharyngis]|uniref:hypothetical protein n=1 Tax=Amycolatopsis palatopharyngis TaxID=187982 RepID=UPI000E22B0C0|nr:hypothetical protein [Amycolatopsis palatopharyngis]